MLSYLTLLFIRSKDFVVGYSHSSQKLIALRLKIISYFKGRFLDSKMFERNKIQRG